MTIMPPQVFLEVMIGDKKLVQRIVIDLFNSTVPKTVENFRCLCTGEKGKKYKGSYFHRVIKGKFAQGGDFTLGNGQGGDSIYGGNFNDENFTHKHDAVGIVSMANQGRNSNKSQFIISMNPLPWLNGKHVVFGRVIDGLNVLMAIDSVGNTDGIPFKPILIANCGQMKKMVPPYVAPHCLDSTLPHSPRSKSPRQHVKDKGNVFIKQWY